MNIAPKYRMKVDFAANINRYVLLQSVYKAAVLIFFIEEKEPV